MLCGLISTKQTSPKIDGNIHNELHFINKDIGIIGNASIKGENLEAAYIPGKSLILGKLFRNTESIASNYPPEGIPGIAREIGIYAFVFWDENNAVLWIGTDRYGLKPFYYYHQDGVFVFSTDLNWLVRNSPKKFTLNYNTFSQYICLRHPFGDQTLFQEILRIPQGELLRYSVKEDQLQSIPYYSYLSIKPNTSITPEQVLTETPARFIAALERQVNGASKVLLPLSGGYDSRLIACGLKALGIELETFTTHKDYKFTTDTIAAAKVAKLLKANHHYKDLPVNYLAQFHQKKCQLVNFETSYHPWVLNLLTILPEKPLPCFDGLGGDACLGGSEVTPEFWSLWRKKEYNKLLQAYFRWYKTSFEGLISSKYHKTIKQLSTEKIRLEFNKLKGNPNGLIYLGLRNFTRRAISLSTFGILARKQQVRVPFFDHEFFDWTLSIPVRLKVNEKIYGQIFRIISGKTATIPTTHQRPDKGRYFQKSPELWRNRQNRTYLGNTIKQLQKYLPGFIKPDLLARLKDGEIYRKERDSLFALADLAYWFELYKNHLNIKGWMK
jgi:asparagine synthetase B (glutamine-hydrolysing)